MYRVKEENKWVWRQSGGNRAGGNRAAIGRKWYFPSNSFLGSL
jgi:hypothetical protein